MARQLEGRHPDVDVLVAFMTAQRQRRGWSQEYLGKKTDLHQGAVSGIETGANVHPRGDTLARLATGLGLHLSLRVDEGILTPEEFADTVALARQLADRGMYVPVWAT